jgi:hypothetical protein
METLERSLVAGVAVNAATPRGEFVKFWTLAGTGGNP